MIWNLIYGCLSLLSCMASVGLGAYLLRDWQNQRARHLFFLLAASGFWSATYGMELLSPDMATKIFWVRLEYLGVGCLSLLLFRFVLIVVGKASFLSTWMARVLWLIPAGVVLAAFTNGFHHLLWKDVTFSIRPGIQALEFERGILFWIYTALSYALILIAFGLLVKELVSSKDSHRIQVGIMLAGFLFPWAANWVYLTKVESLAHIDFSPLAFMLTSTAFTVALFRYHLLHLIPLAHEAVMDGLGDPVIVLDMKEQVVEVNHACVSAFGPDRLPWTGLHGRDIFPCLHQVVC
ncbi:MAG: hypothetical protein HUN05_07460 [Desulfobacter sp.]|nr:MAG: hypothetical protein HUN05_07460 [Desulfobacter sp.]